MNNALTNTRTGRITAPVDAELTVARMAILDDDGRAIYAEDGAIGRFVVVECSDDTATLIPIEPGAQIRVTLSGTCDPGDSLKTGADGVAVAGGTSDAVSLVADEAGVDGQDVLSRGPSGYRAPASDELPAIDEGDAGKVLTVKTDETGYELAASGSLPVGTADEAGFPLVHDAVEGVIIADGTLVVVPGALQVGCYTPSLQVAGRIDIHNDVDGAVVATLNGTGGAADFSMSDAANGVTILAFSSDGAEARIKFPQLPTSDPVEAGRMWLDGTTLKISAGT